MSEIRGKYINLLKEFINHNRLLIRNFTFLFILAVEKFNLTWTIFNLFYYFHIQINYKLMDFYFNLFEQIFVYIIQIEYYKTKDLNLFQRCSMLVDCYTQ